MLKHQTPITHLHLLNTLLIIIPINSPYFPDIIYHGLTLLFQHLTRPSLSTSILLPFHCQRYPTTPISGEQHQDHLIQIILANLASADYHSPHLDMSGAARRRGGRGGRGPANEMSDTSSRRGGGQSIGIPAAPPGGFDGPASRGSASGPPGSQSQRRGSNAPSNAPSAPGSAPQSQPTSPHLSQGQFGNLPSSQPGSRAGAPLTAQEPPRGDPARDPANRPKFTDSLKNVDLPPSFYNINHEVSFQFPVTSCSSSSCAFHCCTLLVCLGRQT